MRQTDVDRLLHGARAHRDPEEFIWRLISDPVFLAELTYCDRHGIPHSVFLGRVVGPTDPQWTRDDRVKALAFARFAAERCSGCGLHPLQWPNDHRGEDPFRVELSRCQGCRAMAREADRIPEGQSTAGVRFSFVPVEGSPTIVGLDREEDPNTS